MPGTTTIPTCLPGDVEFIENNSGTFGVIETFYVTVNPLHDGVLARSANRLRAFVKDNELTTDGEVLRRCWLLIDCDAVKPKNISSTDAEHEEALAVTHEVMAWLTEKGFPQPILADSGNGGHLLYRVDLPNDADTRRMFSDFLKALKRRFDTQTVKIDDMVVNAARVWKLYGTMVRKGEEVGGRKHRLAKIITMPDRLEILPANQITAIVADLSGESVDNPSQDDVVRSVKWVDRFLERNDAKVQSHEPYQGGNKWLLEQCPFCENTDRCAVVTVSSQGVMGFRCQHNSCKDQHWREFRAYFDNQENGDYNDVGMEDVPGDLGDGEQIEQHGRKQSRAYRIKELFQLPPVSWQVDRHLPHGSLCCIYGRYGTGKSFYAVDLALSAASGRPFLGHFTLSAMPVAYIAAEGHIGIAKRMHAWLDYFKIETPENLVVLPERHNLLDARSLAELKEVMCNSLNQPPKLIICDTLARMFCGGDENSTKDMNRFVENVTQLGAMCEGDSIVVVHHVGKDETRGARGSVALAGACDTMIEVTANKTGSRINSLSVRCEKQKDGPEFPKYGLNIQRVDLPFDDHGSLVLVPTDAWEFKAQSLNDKQQAALRTLHKTFGLDEYTWKEAMTATGLSKSSFWRYLEKFKEAGFVQEASSGALVNQEDAALVLSDMLNNAV